MATFIALTVLLLCVLVPVPVLGQALSPPFHAGYTVTSLGSVPDLPADYGGLTFKRGDPGTLLIGGSANNPSAAIYAIRVARGANQRITGFTGSASRVASAPGLGDGGIDGGLAYGPLDLLFFTTWNDNIMGQIKPGSTAPDKMIDLTSFGVEPSVGTLTFVPPGFPGAGRLKIASYTAGTWHDATLVADASGTFDVVEVTERVIVGGGPEGIVYVAAGNAQFSAPSVLITEFDNDRVSAYEVDAAGDPIPATRRDFLTRLTGVPEPDPLVSGGAQGAVVDPLTGDVLFSTFGNANQDTAVNRVLIVRGFLPPPPAVTGFLCYSAKTTARTPKIGGTDVVLTDRFQSGDARVNRVTALCTPPATGETETALKGYAIVPEFTHVPRRGVMVENPLHPDGLQVDTVKVDRLLMPAAVSAAGPVSAAGANDVSAFECYTVRPTRGTPPFPTGLQTSVTDPFNGVSKTIDLDRPTRLCTPVSVNHQPVQDADGALLCYQASPARGQARHTPVKRVQAADELGQELVDTVRETELCVPSDTPGGG
jgi:hypothetical protein